jgi:hypothetical protein
VTDNPVRRAGVRARAAALLGAGLVAAAGLAFVADRKADAPAPVARTAKPTLMLLTTLPLIFGEKFGLEGGGSPALSALAMRYKVTPIGITDARTLARGRLLLMAHPLAQPAEALVDLDQWVRRGGRLMLLADPMLEWHSELPLGDPLRPPPAFADTGLLAHWGLRLDAPDERGPRQLELGGQPILTASPGSLVGRTCPISKDRLVAHCRIGKGEVTIVADADFLDVEDLDGPTGNNLNAMLTELAALER